MHHFEGRIGLLQRGVPHYRGDLIDQLLVTVASVCSFFAGEPKERERSRSATPARQLLNFVEQVTQGGLRAEIKEVTLTNFAAVISVTQSPNSLPQKEALVL